MDHGQGHRVHMRDALGRAAENLEADAKGETCRVRHELRVA